MVEGEKTTLAELLANLDGTITISRKPNGMQIHIFMPFRKKPKKEKKVPQFTSTDLESAKALDVAIRYANPHIKQKPMATLEKWAETFRVMRVVDGHNINDISEVVKFVYFNKEDLFWSSRILSAGKLREKYDTLLGQARSVKSRSLL